MIFINHSEILDGKVVIVDLKGALDSSTSLDFEKYIDNLLEKDKIFLIFDGSGLEFVSSAGIGVMLYVQQKISEKNGSFILFNLADEIVSLYELLGFNSIFKIALSRIDAMQIMDNQLEMRENNSDAEEIFENEIVEENNFNEEEEDVENLDFEIEDEIEPFDNEDLDNEIDEEQIDNEIIDDIVIEDDSSLNDLSSFEPFVVECNNCKTLIRVRNVGDFKCPDCGIEFTVKDSKTVVF